MDRRDKCRALDQIGRRVEQRRLRVSRATHEHEHWIHAELTRALTSAHPEQRVLDPQTCCSDVASLFTPANVNRYLTAADEDLLRRNPRQIGTPSFGTAQARRRGVRTMARWFGIDLDLQISRIPLHANLTTRQTSALWRFVADAPHRHPRRITVRDGIVLNYRWAMDVRMAAVVALVLATDVPTGQFLSMRTTDFTTDLSAITLPGDTEPTPLPEQAQAALRAWLDAHRELTASLGGTPPTALWVSIRGGGGLSAAERDHPARPGMPLGQVACLRTQFARACRETNAANQNTPGFVPIPRTLDRLRQRGKKRTSARTARQGETSPQSAPTAA